MSEKAKETYGEIYGDGFDRGYHEGRESGLREGRCEMLLELGKTMFSQQTQNTKAAQEDSE